jgi:shikimate dehydrogenase
MGLDRYAVIGNPVAHSKSPLIHAQFARDTAQSIEYQRLLAPEGGFGDAIARLLAEGGRGANITLPFKEEAFRMAHVLSERARAAGAVNTLRFDQDLIFGDNTDGAGLVRDIVHNLGMPLARKRLLLLGAGGAARGVVSPLLEQGPLRLVIANRTVARAEQLAAHFGRGVEALSFEALADQRFDVVINATSAGIGGGLPSLPTGLFAGALLAYDMMYGPGAQPFIARATVEGAALLADGLGMLVEQAAESFFLWRGVRPATAAVLAALRAGRLTESGIAPA